MQVIIGRIERTELIKELYLGNLKANGRAVAREGIDGDTKVILYSFLLLKKVIY